MNAGERHLGSRIPFQISKHIIVVLISLIVALGSCLFTTAPAHAGTPYTTTNNLLNSVGGTVYIDKNIDWKSAAQYYANGSWHNVSDLTPADPANQDGNPVDLENGWKMRWIHTYYSGVYMVYRAPDNGKVTLSGSTWSGFKMRFNNIGYTTSGERISSIVEFNSVHAWQLDSVGLKEPAFVCPFHLGDRFGLTAAAVANSYPVSLTGYGSSEFDVGIKSRFTTTLVKDGTDTPIESDNEFNVTYWDIDQPIHHGANAFPRISDFTHPGREGVGLVSGYKSALIGNNTTLKVSEEGGTTWFKSSKKDDSKVPDDISTVVAKAGPSFVTEWSGEGCDTGMGYDSSVTVYPEWPAPVKSPERQILNRGEIATFDVTEKFPYVADTNKASSIVMTDTLDNALDASHATVKVLKKVSGNYVDVTDNWTIGISGQTITATAKNTGHGYAEDEHVFHITVPVSTTADLNSYERETINGISYWKVPNQASVAINNNAKVTNTVHVFVPYEAKGSIQLKAIKHLEGGTLQDGQFTFTLKDQDGTKLDTQKNDASGNVTFKEINYTLSDVGKTFTYTIEEQAENTPGVVYDTHVETVTVTVEDAGEGKLKLTPSYGDNVPVFKNTRKIPLTVIKKSTDGSLLPGAEFTLYKDDGNGVYDDNDQPATVYSDANLTAAIPGAVVTTDGNGEAHYYGLMPGTDYWLKETKAPAGYNLDTAAHLISVAHDGTVSTKDSGGTTAALPLKDGVAAITIADESIPNLPHTAGSDATAILLFLGSLLAIGGGGAVMLRRRSGSGLHSRV